MNMSLRTGGRGARGGGETSARTTLWAAGKLGRVPHRVAADAAVQRVRERGVGMARVARTWGLVVVLGASLVGACGDDLVIPPGTDSDSDSGSSSGSSTEGPVPTSSNPTTEPTTEPPPTTSATTTTTTLEPTTDTTSPITNTTTDTDTSTGTTATTQSTETDTDTDTSTGTDTDTDTDTGGALVGRSVSQTVNGGTKASSDNFTMVFTVGQPTQNQGVYTSTNFRLQGGLIGANGNPP
jgi:cytoskeletal protein RodZ